MCRGARRALGACSKRTPFNNGVKKRSQSLPEHSSSYHERLARTFNQARS